MTKDPGRVTLATTKRGPTNPCRILGRERGIAECGSHLYLCSDSGGVELHRLPVEDFITAMLEWRDWRIEQDRLDEIDSQRRQQVRGLRNGRDGE